MVLCAHQDLITIILLNNRCTNCTTLDEVPTLLYNVQFKLVRNLERKKESFFSLGVNDECCPRNVKNFFKPMQL